MKLPRLVVNIDGVGVSGFAIRTGDELWVHVQNQTLRVPLQSAKTSRSRATPDLAGGTLKAPMPGKLIKISGQDGQKIQAGESIIVMEAMKMEYSIKAPFSGELKLTSTKKVGEQVTLNEVLGEVIRDEN